ncbi:hypothetical protein [Trichocoleus sp. DQ-A2]
MLDKMRSLLSLPKRGDAIAHWANVRNLTTLDVQMDSPILQRR